MKIRYTFFDAAGTLFRVRGSVGEIYSRCAGRFGLEVCASEIERAFRAAFGAKEPLSFPGSPPNTVPDLERGWWKEVVAGTFRKVGSAPQLDAIFESLYEIFRTREGWELEPGCKELLVKLKDQGRQLGIISNFDSRLTEVLRDLGIIHCFDSITFSSCGPAAKPDSLIFAHALRQADCEPKCSLHVGNDLEHDFLGARRAGMKALLYDPQDRFLEVAGQNRVRSLAQIASFIKGSE